MVVGPFMFFCGGREMGAEPPQEFSLILSRARGEDERGWWGHAGGGVRPT